MQPLGCWWVFFAAMYISWLPGPVNTSDNLIPWSVHAPLVDGASESNNQRACQDSHPNRDLLRKPNSHTTNNPFT
eukprot:c22346_g1_i1 orf=170-394(-)